MGNDYKVYCSDCIKNINKIRNMKKHEDSIYIISTGGGFNSFHKDQLSNNIINNGLLNDDLYIIDEIVENKKNGLVFDDPVGYVPYYCDRCMTLESKYYFQMIRKNKIYIPKYKCKSCNNILKSIVLEDEMNECGGWAEKTEVTPGMRELIIKKYKNNLLILDYNEIDQLKICKKCKDKCVNLNEKFTRCIKYEINEEINEYKIKCKKCNGNNFNIILWCEWD